MDESLKHHNPNPILTANPLSKLLFWWMNPIFKIGYKRRLEVDDMYNVTNEDSSEELGKKLEREWHIEVEKKEKENKSPSLFKCILRIFGLHYALLGVIVFIEEVTKVIQPLLLGQLIRYFTPKSTITQTDAYLYAMGISLSAIILAIAHHPYFFTVQRIGMQIRVACCSLLYRKALRLSNKAIGQTTTGQIVNLMSNDVNRFDTAVMFIHYLWIGPSQAIFVLVILWIELGPSALAGFAVLLCLVPVQSLMGKLFAKLRHKTAVHTDERVKVMNEIIGGMRVIKMYCWEKPFGEFVAKIRGCELTYIQQSRVISGFQASVWTVGPRLLYVVVVIPSALTGVVLLPERLYICLALLFILTHTFLGCVFLAITRASESVTTLNRIKTFLQLEELDQSSIEDVSGLRPKPADCVVEVDHLTAKWDPKLDQPTLNDISVTVGPGKLLAVIGPVGAGKSSLLMSILRELPLTEGNVKVQGKISYVSQQPWVFSASLRQNIVFGNKFDGTHYNKIIKACALDKDIAVMPDGDSTLIGDRGVSLSGGQRARVSLARALYMDADIYLLDDPLSAVDSVVSHHLFEKVIKGMLRKKPRILVTHQLHFLKEADEIIILKEGQCLGIGSFDTISTSGIDFSSLLKSNEEEEKEKPPVVVYERATSVDHAHSSLQNIGSTFSLVSIGTEFEPDPIKRPEEEERREGGVGWWVYYRYFQAGSGPLKFSVLVILNLIAQAAYILSDWWLARWANMEEDRAAILQQVGSNNTNITVTDSNTDFNVAVFSGIIVAVFVFGLLRALMYFKVAVDAAKHLHNRMFKRLLRVPLRFFDTNPVGRVLNRFSKDTGHMDDNLPITFFDYIQCVLLILGIIIVVTAIIPYVFILLVPMCILLYITRRYHITTSRHIKRLEGTTRSPVFSHLSASLQGLHTIRALGVQERFCEEFDNHQNLHTESWFLFLSSSRWLAIRLDWMCGIFVTAVSFACVYLAKDLNAGLVGLLLTYAMTLMGMFQWAVRQSAEVESQMISVERVLEYSKLDTEVDLDSDSPPPPSWPQYGKIIARNAKLRYGPESPWVFQGLNFVINEKEKVGLVGRTGAGKSSLISLMFRMAEIQGSIIIDDLDTQKIGLHELRNKISIIPQDPVLFTGPLRKNLDPFKDSTDEQLWKALEEVQLKPAVDDLPGKLDSEVSEDGANFSVGQRQLICLARAILRRNQILMIDEATANVDPRTDSLIQKTIREKFKHCTVITIAHRLNTIMDSDKVMVLDEGQMVEYNHPYVLLQDADGYLCRMVQQTGKGEAQRLLDIAKSTYNSIPLEERPVLTKKSETITADDIYLSQENGDVTSFGANHVPQMQGGTEHSFSSGVVSNMSPSLDRSEENGPDINEDIDDSETSSLLTKQLEATPCRSSHSIDSSPEDEPPTETSTLHQHASEATYPKEESNEVSETTELLNGDHTDQ
ncbi:ATP-binding cassette sub-family C member 4-like isoform X2 [Ostrea edulis]|uniref:ATP-binding cassette sub-family C member 4-like isoform X2 n=1 Tax=Ostrea edulis TaxID=37623 RepID=UPI0024AF34E9|nr:ATP-binding cassette sub-family C member 4-like isoform X2 [Ostrea edulis]